MPKRRGKKSARGGGNSAGGGNGAVSVLTSVSMPKHSKCVLHFNWFQYHAFCMVRFYLNMQYFGCFFMTRKRPSQRMSSESLYNSSLPITHLPCLRMSSAMWAFLARRLSHLNGNTFERQIFGYMMRRSRFRPVLPKSSSVVIPQDDIICVATHPQMPITAFGNYDGQVMLESHGKPGKPGKPGKSVRLPDKHNGEVRSLCFSRNKPLLASGGDDGVIRIFCFDSKLNDRNCLLLSILYGHTSAVWSISFCLNSENLVSGSNDHQLKLWKLCEAKCVSTVQYPNVQYPIKQPLFFFRNKPDPDSILAVELSPDGFKFAVCGSECSITIWNFCDETLGLVSRNLNCHQSKITCLLWLSDNKLASGSWDGDIKIWDIEGMKLLVCFKAHNNRIWVLKHFPFKPNCFLTASNDKTARIWQLEMDRNEVKSAVLHSGGASAFICGAVCPNMVCLVNNDRKLLKVPIVLEMTRCQNLTPPAPYVSIGISTVVQINHNHNHNCYELVVLREGQTPAEAQAKALVQVQAAEAQALDRAAKARATKIRATVNTQAKAFVDVQATEAEAQALVRATEICATVNTQAKAFVDAQATEADVKIEVEAQALTIDDDPVTTFWSLSFNACNIL